MEGFGEKSYQNLMDSIGKARHTTLQRLIYALGIPGFGVANAKMVCRHYDHDPERLMNADAEELALIEGIGEVLAGDFTAYFAREENRELFLELQKELTLEKPQTSQAEQKLSGQTFVITGSVNHFANRGEVKELIESLGGKVTGSVTSKTDYLINNDTTSTSGKNKKAKELGIAIISEEEFLEMIQ
jgi:DNA ligase (NAD+)